MTVSTSPCFFRMHNVIQDYAWGSTTSIESLFGIANPEGKPQAEIWMGVHPNGCSKIDVAGKATRLAEFIDTDKAAIIGADTEQQFGELPYLFKVLAADKALSIQVHPSKSQAEVGFAKEQDAGIPHSAGHRNYKDPNHKPELVYALTPYQAMNGFREIAQIVTLFRCLEIADLQALVVALEENQNEGGLRQFFEAMLSLRGETKETAVSGLLTYAEQHKDDALFALILELAEQYPGDIGLFSPLMLNVLILQPGEAMFLDACTPHAYIKGTGLEIMANSDNVLRAGLTPKHMDISELVTSTRFVPMPADTLLLAPEQSEGGLHYPIPVPDFKFSVYHSQQEIVLTMSSAEILLAIDEPVTVIHSNGETLTIEKGESMFIPNYAGSYTATSTGRFARAYN
ncbi:mannose-6-phosphate isomerase, class I [Photobacterium chitinilyticum]|uniref:Mannose-6-phosphate isomerase n=1 Tax=Photobacterium chitinilyticum TaxID=2485123 RepID=A0A3S3QNK0_9GAMM|nr:mannose-6-phosphate isomerase, class I [Photobacterium chitinilyticum]RWX54518.1 mannose-6-phosphate isomerase, class I [Photobacterium chitinilyticum]